MVDAGFVNPTAFPYNSAGSLVTIATDYTAFFTHSQTTDCLLTSCTLMDAGCAAALPAQTDVSLGASPFGVSETELKPVGYLLTFCLQCEITPTGLAPIYFNKDSVTVE